MPALYSLAFRRLLPERFGLVGVARTEETDDEFRERMKEAVQEFARDPLRDDVWNPLAEGMRFVGMEFTDETGWDRVVSTLNELDEQRGTAGNRVYYLAVPPAAFSVIVEQAGKRRGTDGWTRLIVEKPFGHDQQSARALNDDIHRFFAEPEIFRIDHYLGKE